MITLESDVERAIGVRSSVSAVIFDRRGRLLLQPRSDGGQWGLPGGSVKAGESVEFAVRREVREEAGLFPAGPSPGDAVAEPSRPHPRRAHRVAAFVR